MAHILMKYGGGLITTKSQMKTVDRDAISKLSRIVSEVSGLGHKVTIVHGAGSFGHLKAKQWNIANGAQEDIIEQQKEAVNSIREDMLQLNTEVCNSLSNHDIESKSFPPSDWARDTGADFSGDLSPIENCSEGVVPITFGDVVDCSPPKLFGILSGDDLMVRIGKEIPGITHCIFLLGDTEGLLSAPPSDPNAALIPVWKKDQEVSGEHDTSQDVTGGIFLKLESASMISTIIPNVWFIDGRKPERVIELLKTGTTRGTQIVQ